MILQRNLRAVRRASKINEASSSSSAAAAAAGVVVSNSKEAEPESPTTNVSRHIKTLTIEKDGKTSELKLENIRPNRVVWDASAVMDVRDWSSSGKQHLISNWLRTNRSDDSSLSADRSQATLMPVHEDLKDSSSNNNNNITTSYRQSPTRWIAAVQNYVTSTCRDHIVELVYGSTPVSLETSYYLALLIQETLHPSLPFWSIVFDNSGDYDGDHRYWLTHPYLPLVLMRDQTHARYGFTLKGGVHTDVLSVLKMFELARRTISYEWQGTRFSQLSIEETQQLVEMMRGSHALILSLRDIDNAYTAQCIASSLRQPGGFHRLEVLKWHESAIFKENPKMITDEVWDAISRLPNLMILWLRSYQTSLPTNLFSRMREGFATITHWNVYFDRLFGRNRVQSKALNDCISAYLDAWMSRSPHVNEYLVMVCLNEIPGTSAALRACLPKIFTQCSYGICLPPDIPIVRTLTVSETNASSFKLWKVYNTEDDEWSPDEVSWQWYSEASDTPDMNERIAKLRQVRERQKRRVDYDSDMNDRNLSRSERSFMADQKSYAIFDAKALPRLTDKQLLSLYCAIHPQPRSQYRQLLSNPPAREVMLTKLTHHRIPYQASSLYREDKERPIQWPDGWSVDEIRKRASTSPVDCEICEGDVKLERGGSFVTDTQAMKTAKDRGWFEVEVRTLSSLLGYNGFSQLRSFCATRIPDDKLSEELKSKPVDDPSRLLYHVVTELVDGGNAISLRALGETDQHTTIFSPRFQIIVGIRLRQRMEILASMGYLQNDLHRDNVFVNLMSGAVSVIDFDQTVTFDKEYLRKWFATTDDSVANSEHALLHDMMNTLSIHDGAWWSSLPRATTVLIERIIHTLPAVKKYPIIQHLLSQPTDNGPLQKRWVELWYPKIREYSDNWNWTYLTGGYRRPGTVFHTITTPTHTLYSLKEYFNTRKNQLYVLGYDTVTGEPKQYPSHLCVATNEVNAAALHQLRKKHFEEMRSSMEASFAVGDRVALNPFHMFGHPQVDHLWTGRIQSMDRNRMSVVAETENDTKLLVELSFHDIMKLAEGDL